MAAISINIHKAKNPDSNFIIFSNQALANDPAVIALLNTEDSQIISQPDPESGRYDRVLEVPSLDAVRLQNLADVAFSTMGLGDIFINVTDRREIYCGPEILPKALGSFACNPR